MLLREKIIPIQDSCCDVDEMSIVDDDVDDVKVYTCKVDEQVLDLSFVSCSVPLKKRKISSIKSGDRSICDDKSAIKDRKQSAFTSTDNLISPSSTSSSILSSLSTTSSKSTTSSSSSNSHHQFSSFKSTSSSSSTCSKSSLQSALNNNPPKPLAIPNYTDSNSYNLNCNLSQKPQQQSTFTFTGNSKQSKFIEVTASETPPSHFLSSPFKTGYNRNLTAGNTSTGQVKGVYSTYFFNMFH